MPHHQSFRHHCCYKAVMMLSWLRLGVLIQEATQGTENCWQNWKVLSCHPLVIIVLLLVCIQGPAQIELAALPPWVSLVLTIIWRFEGTAPSPPSRPFIIANPRWWRVHDEAQRMDGMVCICRAAATIWSVCCTWHENIGEQNIWRRPACQSETSLLNWN